MKIVVKSTKTISFDENFEDDDSSEHENHEEEDDEQNNNEINSFEDFFDKSMGTVSGPENGGTSQNNTSDRTKEGNVNYFNGLESKMKGNKSSSFGR